MARIKGPVMRALIPVLLLGIAVCSGCGPKPAPEPASLYDAWHDAGDTPIRIDSRWLVIELREHGAAWLCHVNGSDEGLSEDKMRKLLIEYADQTDQSPALPGRVDGRISENPVVLRAPPQAPALAVVGVLEQMVETMIYRTVLQLTGVAGHQALMELPKDESLGAWRSYPAEYVHIRFEAPAADSLRLTCSTTDSQTREVDIRPSELFGNGWNASLYRRKRGLLAKALIDLQGTGPRARSWINVQALQVSDAFEAPYAALVLAFDAIRFTTIHPDRGDRPRLMSGWYFEMTEPPPPPEVETGFPE
jgi:hypothetical protein